MTQVDTTTVATVNVYTSEHPVTRSQVRFAMDDADRLLGRIEMALDYCATDDDIKAFTEARRVLREIVKRSAKGMGEL